MKGSVAHSLLTYYVSILIVMTVLALVFSTTSFADESLEENDLGDNNSKAIFLEEMVVTAQKREESLQDVPISVSTITGESIQAESIRELEELTFKTPNVTISETALGDKVFIRGIGSGVNPGFEQSVGTFIDGIYHGRGTQSRNQFLDIERIEVLRGPQSIFLGRNAIAGAFNITTHKPTFKVEGYVTTLFEPEHGEYNVEFVQSGPITDTLALRGAGKFSGIDGWVHNEAFNEDEPNEDNEVGRLTALWIPNEVFDATAKIEVGSFEVTGRSLQNIKCPPDANASAGACALTLGFFPAFDDEFDENKNIGGIPQSFVNVTTAAGAPPPNNILGLQDKTDLDTRNFTLTLNYDLYDHTITSVTGFSGFDNDNFSDFDRSPLPLLSGRLSEEFDQFSQELRITSPIGGRFDYLAGIYYQSSDLDFSTHAPFYLAPPFFTTPTIATVNADHKQEEESIAAFFSLTWNVTDTIRLTFGGRYTNVDKKLSRIQSFEDNAPGVTTICNAVLAGITGCIIGTPLAFTAASPPIGTGFGWRDGALNLSRSDNDFTPAFNIQWDVSEDILTYFSYTQGFKAGGFDAGNLRLDSVDGQFEPETVDVYEIGAKTYWLNNRLLVNLAIFRSEYDNLQVSTFDGGVNFLVNNAASSITQGIELESRMAVTENLNIGFSFSWLDAFWDEFKNAQCTSAQFTAAQVGNFSKCSVNADGFLVQDLSGQDLLMAPEFSGHFFAEYTRPLQHNLKFTTQLNVSFEDDFFLDADNDPNLVQEAYAKVGARISLGDQDDAWEIAIVGKNLNDELTTHHGADQPLSSAGSFFKFTDRPRSIALQATYRW